jgi:hypothetical protein
VEIQAVFQWIPLENSAQTLAKHIWLNRVNVLINVLQEWTEPLVIQKVHSLALQVKFLIKQLYQDCSEPFVENLWLELVQYQFLKHFDVIAVQSNNKWC